jgi:hypothetical protein
MIPYPTGTIAAGPRSKKKCAHAVDPRRAVRLKVEPKTKETSMQYLLLIYDNEKTLAAMSEDERGKFLKAYGAFTQEAKASGNHVAGEALQRVATATTVRIRDGKTVTTDGPFAETREQLGGFYLVEAKDLDEARALAARIPSARTGSIEVRPIQKYM